jgi:hypothetical protein
MTFTQDFYWLLYKPVMVNVRVKIRNINLEMDVFELYRTSTFERLQQCFHCWQTTSFALQYTVGFGLAGLVF